MNTLSTYNIGNVIRTSALYGSAVAALMFGTTFVTDYHLSFHYERILLGREDYFGVTIFFGLLFSVFASYLLAAKKKFAIQGSLLAIFFVGGLYAWYQAANNFVLSPYVAVLAVPAFLHILAVKSNGMSHQGEIVSLPNETFQAANAYEAA